jgi:predicted transcriptional regulator
MCPAPFGRIHRQEVVVMPVDSSHVRASVRLTQFTLSVALGTAFASSNTGCSTMPLDPHTYNIESAQNCEEAAEKTKVQIVTLKSKARELIQAGEIGKAKKIQREITKIEDWQIKCYRDRDKFAKAAQDLEKKNKDQIAAKAEKKDANASVAAKNSAGESELH